MPARRTRAKLVRLTPEEFAEIEQRAKAAGEVPARYLRNAALGGVPTAAHCSLASPEIVHTLGMIGADLKALARSAADPRTQDRAQRTLDELLETLRRLTIESRGS